MKLSFIVFIGLIYSSPHGSEKNDLARELIEASGVESNSTEIIRGLISQFKVSRQNIPDDFWEKFEKSIKINELVELLIPAYADIFSVEEIKDLLVFYKSKTGRLMLEKMPMVSQKTILISKNWSMEILKKLDEKIRERK